MPAYATPAEWVAGAARAFSLDADAGLHAAVDGLVVALGDGVALLGLGEALHGGEEILLLRNRLFQRLVAAHGYSAIAIESSFSRGHLVNEYVLGRGPSSYDALAESGFSHGFGRLTANRDLVEWMRQHNADPAHTVKLHFYGCDSPTEMTGTDSPRQLLYFALDYLAALDNGHSQARQRRIDDLLGEDAAWENPAAMMDPAQAVGLSVAAALRLETEDLITELEVRRPALVAASDQDRHSEALQYAVAARQLLNYHAALAQSSDRLARPLGIRDAMMADNLVYAVAHERGRGKVLVFAHNRHLQDGPVEWQLGPHHIVWWPAGAQLRVLLGAAYAVIGTGVGVSTDNGIGQPQAGTLEALLTGPPEPVQLIPTHSGHSLPAAQIAALPERAGSVRNSTYMPLNAASFRDFDWLVVLHEVTYSRGGPPLPPDAGRAVA